MTTSTFCRRFPLASVVAIGRQNLIWDLLDCMDESRFGNDNISVRKDDRYLNCSSENRVVNFHNVELRILWFPSLQQFNVQLEWILCRVHILVLPLSSPWKSILFLSSVDLKFIDSHMDFYGGVESWKYHWDVEKCHFMVA